MAAILVAQALPSLLPPPTPTPLRDGPLAPHAELASC